MTNNVTKLVQIPTGMFKVPIDADGNPLVGGKVYTYAAGTTTKITTWTDSTGLTPNTNPIILDARGECNIWVPAAAAQEVDSGTPGPPGPAGPPGASGAGGIPHNTVEFTTAQLVSLNTPGTALEILPALGSGITGIPIRIVCENLPDTTAFTTVGTVKFSYKEALTTSPNVAVNPDMDILTDNEPRIDYAPLINTSVVGLGFESDDGSVTYAARVDVANQPIVMWCNDGAFDGGEGVDMGLRVTIYYLTQDAAITPVPPALPDNQVDNGIVESYRLAYQDNTGNTLTAAFWTFDALPGSPGNFADIHVQQNVLNPPIISATGTLLTVNYPCIVEASVNLRGGALQTPFLAEGSVTHTADSDEVWSSSEAFSSDALWPTVVPANMNVTSGPIRVPAGDVWGASIDVGDLGLGGDVYVLNQADFALAVLSVRGRCNAVAIDDGGTGYAVGDTFKINGGYVPAVGIVTSETGGVVDGFAFPDIGQSLGLGYTVGIHSTTGIPPTPGAGFGLTMNIISVES